MTLDLARLKVIKFLLKYNIKIGRKLVFYNAKYSTEKDVGQVAKRQKFDLEGWKNRMEAVTIKDQDIIDKRWEICKGCEFLTEKNTCQKCGCFMKVKTKVATVACPIGKWDKEYNFIQGQPVNKPTNETQLAIK